MIIKERLSKRAVMKDNGVWMGLSSTEKTNTKKNLARAMTKSPSGRQTVTNGCVSRKDNESCWGVFKYWRPCRVSKIEA